MSDQALVWKFAFGALVLLASSVAFVMRNDTPAVKPAGPVGPPVELAPAPPPAAKPVAPAVEEIAPADVPEAQETPVRIRIALREAHEARRPAKHLPTAKLRFVRATHEQARRPRHPSPYIAGRPHYPFDPRDRWRSREG